MHSSICPRCRFFVSVFALLTVLSPVHAQIITGAPAIDGLGQYDQTSFTNPVFKFDKGSDDQAPTTFGDDAPNRLGMGLATKVAVDEVRHRLFVLDGQWSRILVYNLNEQNRPAVRVPQHVLGQPDFTSSRGGSGAASLNGPQAIAYSPARDLLFVADWFNNRVLVFDVSTITNGESAIRVIGQPDFSTTTLGATSARIGLPTGLAVDDAGGRLFVSTGVHSRVLVFDIATITNGEAATHVLGQPSFVSSANPTVPNQQNMLLPRGLAFDSEHGRLFVADAGFNRVVVFDVNTIINNEPAASVVCQSDFVSNIADSNPDKCEAPSDVVYDSDASDDTDKLYVADLENSRVQVYLFADPSFSPGLVASAALGQQESFTKNPTTTQTGLRKPQGIALAGSSSTLYVADTDNYRVMVFDVATSTTGEAAIDLFGQYDETSYSNPVPRYTKGSLANGPNLFGFGFNTVHAVVDEVNHRLFVSDVQHQRVLVYNLDQNNNLTNKIPVAVLGQSDFASKVGGTTQTTLNSPTHLVFDGSRNRLYVADRSNHRVLVFDTTTIQSGQAAIAVLGQSNFTTATNSTTQSKFSFVDALALDQARQLLFAADNKRVLVFDVQDITNGENAVAVLGQPNFTSSQSVVSATGLSFPSGLAYDGIGKRLFVADSPAHRVLTYDVAEITNGEAAVGVLCQTSFNSNGSGTTANACNNPGGLAYDPEINELYVSDFARVLTFDMTQTGNGREARAVLGQVNFTSNAGGISASAIKSAGALALNVSAKRLFVSDDANFRILIFPTRYAFTYSGSSFTESSANNGTIGTAVAITLTGDVFAPTSPAQLTRGEHYTISGVPSGLTEVVTLTSQTTASISFSGSAAAHESANNASPITLTFLTPAVKSVAAASIQGFSKNFSLAFTDAPASTPTPAPSLCFGGVLPKPSVSIKGTTATVTLPKGIVASAQCVVKARGTIKGLAQPKLRAIATGARQAKLSKLKRGRWQFSYTVTTVSSGTTQTSVLRTALVR